MNSLSKKIKTLNFTNILQIKYFKTFYIVMEKNKNSICNECKGYLDEKGFPLEETVKSLFYIIKPHTSKCIDFKAHVTKCCYRCSRIKETQE